jgi:pimeloyl-ACP methyl ester carboxylesterase
VITYIQQALDRMCIGLATASVRSGWRRPDQTDRAAKMLAAPDLLTPEVGAAALEFKSKRRFVFNSVVKTSWDVTPCHGVFWRAGRDWRNKPAVILIHGWNGEMGYYFSFPGIQMALARRGVNALKFELPFHGLRRPMKRGEINNLISDDLVTMIEGVRQCLADILSLRMWLLEQGCPSVSLWGYSLGGWLAGLLSAHPQPFKAAVLMNAVARMDIAMAILPFGKPVRESLAVSPVNLDMFSLHNLKPTTDRILIMEGVRDLFVPAETLDDLAAHWKNAELWRMRHSHISICFGPLTLLRAVRWLARNANENPHGH